MNIRLTALLLLSLAACSPRTPAPEQGRPWREFVLDLTRVDALPRLDVPGTELISTFDPTGANDDFNRFRGPGREAGWVLLADLTGPGVVRRFWTTGQDPGHRFRLYFDGATKPQVDGTIEEVFGGRAPFQVPLARYLNLCWFSYVPLTYQKSLRIEMEAPNTHPLWGPRRLFYQLNVERLPAGTMVQAFPTRLTPEDEAALRAVATAWSNAVVTAITPADPAAATTIAPGASASLLDLAGPGRVESWTLHLAPAGDGWTALEREALLQDAVLRVFYDGQIFASIETPAGDFFGQPWRRRQYGTQLFAAAGDQYTCRMPMPFRSGLRIELVNGAGKPIRAQVTVTRGAAPGAHDGYLHAEWRRTGPEPGQPHPVAAFRGDGKYVGTLLGVTGTPQSQPEASWWILEGDEQMYLDGATRPAWHGTGLEDYFNGGWYYRGTAFTATHGIFDRSPFRVAQFRHQLVDPVRFTNLFQMVWERGDRNVSRGYFQTVAYAYLRAPTAVSPVPAEAAARRAVENPVHTPTLMLQLVELERMNDFAGARALLAETLERQPDSADAGLWRLRDLEYRRLAGETIVEDAYQPFLDGQHGPAAAEQAKLITWFHAAPNRALVGLYASGDAAVFLDGKPVLQGDSPLQLFVAVVELPDGPHQLAASCGFKRGDAWLQLGVRTRDGLAGSGTHSWVTRAPGNDWQTRTDLAGWIQPTLRESPRGVPDAPIIGGTANAFILVQSKAYPLIAPDWGYYRDTFYFRNDFALPLQGWPAHAGDFSGLPR